MPNWLGKYRRSEHNRTLFLLKSPSKQSRLSAMAITYMNNDLFRAAATGDMEPFNNYRGDFRLLVDGMKNTALHIHFSNGQENEYRRFLWFRQTGRFTRELNMNFVRALVDRCPSLLLQPNEKEEIPLHIVAAKVGTTEVVNFIIGRTRPVQNEDVENGLQATNPMKLMLRMKDKDGNTALHKAAERGEVDVVGLLVRDLDADDFVLSEKNKKDETPLYIAARLGNQFSVARILGKCISTAPGGPNGTTALHAASLRGDEGTTRELIRAKGHLIRETDNNGRTPLHYAAHFGARSALELMLEADASTACITDTERGMTALHMSAWQGRIDIMEDIISYCPGCCEIVDKKYGWNFLHFAAVTLDAEKFDTFIYSAQSRIRHLLRYDLLLEEDMNGITPLRIWLLFQSNTRRHPHLTVLDSLKRQGYAESDSNWSVSDSILKEKLRETLKEISNNAEVAGLGVHKSFREGMEDNPLDMNEIVKTLRESHLLVATLVATVTFAAGITVPGGYKSDSTGTATLSGNPSFKAFIITDALSFLSSLFTIFLHFLSAFIDETKVQLLVSWILAADYLTVFAMAAMVVAFSTGTYAMLESSKGVAIATCSIGLTFFPISIIVPLLFRCYYKRRQRGFQQ
ncbi:hypothetical protein DITRI_Ditri15bG0032300 [Diplodiscus trichospermus]